MVLNAIKSSIKSEIKVILGGERDNGVNRGRSMKGHV